MGLLSIAPMSGYELAQAAEGSIGAFWPISKSQVYGELARLEGLGLVDAEDVPQTGVPDKRVYELTADGEERLDAWLANKAVEPSRFRIPFLLKVILGHRLSAGHLEGLLENYRKAAEADLEDIQALLADLEDNPKAVYARATALYMQRVAQATAAWADEVAGSLPKEPVRLDPHRPEPTKARALLRAVPPTRRS